MCGHGVIGLIVTLYHMGKIDIGKHTIETAVGDVIAVLHDDHTVSVQNVESYRYKHKLELDVLEYHTRAIATKKGLNILEEQIDKTRN